jgi:hypothetical protein
MSSERSSTGALGRLHLDGRFLEYERGKAGREGWCRGDAMRHLRATIFFGIG